MGIKHKNASYYLECTQEGTSSSLPEIQCIPEEDSFLRCMGVRLGQQTAKTCEQPEFTCLKCGHT